MSFEDIKGQDRPLEILKDNIREKRVFSSYLFVGPDGVGKFLAAKNFAKAINCLDEEKKPCEKCTSCNKINSNIHPDVFFVEPKGVSFSVGIDQIREVMSKASLKPYEARSKVFVINNAHSMKAEASNAFLKTLEEPPADTVFILISRSKDLLLPTIVSRCHTIKFSSASSELVEQVLMEKFSIRKDEAKILGNFSSQRIGEAIRLKEKNLINRKNRIIDILLNPEEDFSGEIANYAGKEELKENLEFLVSFFRDIFLYKTVKNEKTIFHLDRIEDIRDQCERFSSEELDYLIKKIITLRSYVDYNVNPKIIVDVLTNEVRNYYARSNTGKAARSG